MNRPMGTTSSSSVPSVANRWKARLPSPDRQHQEDQEIVIGAALLAGAPKQELEPDQGGKQKGDIADDVDGLCQQRIARAALAIAEDMLAEVHGPHPFDPLLQERGLPRRRFHRQTFRIHLFCGITARTTRFYV